MTVRHLIERLSQCNPDAEVGVGWYTIVSVEEKASIYEYVDLITDRQEDEV